MNSPVIFNSETNQRFWDSNQSDYFGARHSDSILFLSQGMVGQRILDAGAGDGSMVRLLRSRFPQATVQGIDLAPKNDDVIAGDLTNMPFADGSYDTLFCMEVIEHVPSADITKILQEAFRVLAPGGSLILTTPYNEALEKSHVECPNCQAVFHRYGHQQRFLETDIVNFFQVAGFESAAVFPVKMARVRRYRFFGPKFFQTNFMQHRSRKMSGKLNLIALATKPAVAIRAAA